MDYYRYEIVDPKTTVWELGALLEDSEDFFINIDGRHLPLRVYGCAFQYRFREAWCNLALSLVKDLKQGKVLKKVKVSWTDKLDGTTSNGVWCLVKDTIQSKGSIKLVTSTMNERFVAKNTDFQVQSRWNFAEPVPSYLADALDKYYSVERISNDCNEIRLESYTSIDCNI